MSRINGILLNDPGSTSLLNRGTGQSGPMTTAMPGDATSITGHGFGNAMALGARRFDAADDAAMGSQAIQFANSLSKMRRDAASARMEGAQGARHRRVIAARLRDLFGLGHLGGGSLLGLRQRCRQPQSRWPRRRAPRRQTLRIGRHLKQVECDVTLYHPPWLLGLRLTCGSFKIMLTFDVYPIGSGTRLDYRADIIVTSWAAPLLEIVNRPRCARIMSAHLTNLKSLTEEPVIPGYTPDADHEPVRHPIAAE